MLGSNRRSTMAWNLSMGRGPRTWTMSSAVVLLAVDARLNCDEDADAYEETSVELERDVGMVVVVITVEVVVIIDEGGVAVVALSSKGVMVTVVSALLA